MASWRDLQAARRTGSLAAQRARRRLGLGTEQRVDIFAIIEAEGIWLMFQPLRELYGFYRRLGDVAGIVINTNHPVSLQRYTAAHEFGHHLLGHGFSLDEIHDVDGARGVEEVADFDQTLAARSRHNVGDPLEEAAAQAFAGTFLMPIQVVNRLLVARGFDRDRPALSPVDVYDLSLEFGASYEATVTQLAVLDKITWAATRQLRLPPLQIKATMAGRRPNDARADVWLVHDRDGERNLPLRVGDEVVLRLPENPSSGYAWTLTHRAFSALELVEESVEAIGDDSDLYGGSAVRRVLLRASTPGVDDIVMALQRPWEPEPADTVVVLAIIEDAVQLICWYESQPDCGTHRSDADIALALGWYIGGYEGPKQRHARHGGQQARGDVARVRRTRKYVDDNNHVQPFVGYSFGTKRNGAGVKFSHLITPQKASGHDAINEAVKEQVGRSIQQNNQAAAERARQIAHFELMEVEFVSSGRIEQAFAVHDAAGDLRTFGTLTMPTIQKLRSLGLLGEAA